MIGIERTVPEYLLTFSLQTTATEVLNQFGKPARASSFSDLYIYDYDDFERGEYAWSFVFALSTDQPLCVTRRFDVPQDLKHLFPPTLTKVHQGRGKTARIRVLDEARVLIGVDSQQVVLLKQTSVQRFFPWISFD